MATTYEPIATTTLGSAAASITFSSIPATYTDLRVMMVYTAVSGFAPRIQFNSDAGLNYSYTKLGADGATASSSRGSNNYLIGYGGTPSTTIPSFFTMDVFSYSGLTYKTSLLTSQQDFNGSGFVANWTGLWLNAAAINTITLSGSGTYAAGTTATLYGIKAA